jgi:3-deoxy-D-manno-octulosonic acid kinase
MSDARVVVDGRHVMLVGAELRETPEVQWFDAEAWRRGGAVAIETSGRGQVLIVPHDDDTWVLRHYRRGGLVARLIDDHYLWLGAERTRAFREWRLLRELRTAGLPVPSPVAAHVRRSGPVYTGDIITSYLRDTQKLSWFLARGRAPAECWRRVGAMIRAVHDHGVDHPDLTAHNVLLDPAGNPFLVDFDNAHVRPPGNWRRLGVERFNRSLRKVALETGTEFDAAAWRELTAGYEAPRPSLRLSRRARRESL